METNNELLREHIKLEKAQKKALDSLKKRKRFDYIERYFSRNEVLNKPRQG